MIPASVTHSRQLAAFKAGQIQYIGFVGGGYNGNFSNFITKNIIPDSDNILGTWAPFVNGFFVPGAGLAGTGGAWKMLGTGSPSGFHFPVSQTFDVTPGETYCFSAYCDATFVTAGGIFAGVYDPTIQTNYVVVGITNGTSGRMQASFTVPAGVHKVVVILDTGNCTITSGKYLVFSNPQLELGSVATAYQSNYNGPLKPWLVSIDDCQTTTHDLDGGADQTQLAFHVQDRGGAVTADFPNFTFEGKQFTLETGFAGMFPFACYRILSSGGTDILKLLEFMGTPAVGVKWWYNIVVRNNGLNNVYIADNFSANQNPAHVCPPGQVTQIAFSVTGDGVTEAQFKFACQNISDIMDLVVFGASVSSEANGTNLLSSPGFVTGWTDYSGSTISVTQLATEWTTLFTGYIDNLTSDNGNQEYIINASDISSQLSKVIYTTGDSGKPTDSNNPHTILAHPLDVLLDILNNQVGLPAQFVDTTKIQAYRDGPYSGTQFKFRLTQSVAAIDFIKNQLLKPLGAYLWVNSAGLVTVNFFTPLNGVVTPASDNFQRANANPIGGKWTTLGTWSPVQLLSNAAAGTSTAQDSIAYYNGISWTPNQFSEVTIGALPTGNDYIGPLVRMGPSNNNYYGLFAIGPLGPNVQVFLQKVTPTVTNLWFTNVALNVGDVLRLEAVGTTLTAKINGAVVKIVDDLDLTAGVGGIAFFNASIAGNSKASKWGGGSAVPSLGPRTWTIDPGAEQVDMINTVQFQFDKDDATSTGSNNYLAQDTELFQTSITKYGQYGETVIQADGLRSGLQGFFTARLVSRLVFGRYGLKTTKFDQNSADAIWPYCLLEPGDIVMVTHPRIPDRIAGVIGVTNKLFEVVDRKFNFLEGLVNLTLIEASYLATYGFYLISPNGQADYASGSNTYMYLCNPSNQYSNGDAAHVLG